VNVLGAEIIGGDAPRVGAIAGNALDPATSGIGLGIGLTGTGLSPPLLISTEPIGIPAAEPLPGDEVDIADDDAALPVALVSHVPDDAMPPGNGIPIVIPPPS
jgi:hypothetical protein